MTKTTTTMKTKMKMKAIRFVPIFSTESVHATSAWCFAHTCHTVGTPSPYNGTQKATVRVCEKRNERKKEVDMAELGHATAVTCCDAVARNKNDTWYTGSSHSSNAPSRGRSNHSLFF